MKRRKKTYLTKSFAAFLRTKSKDDSGHEHDASNGQFTSGGSGGSAKKDKSPSKKPARQKAPNKAKTPAPTASAELAAESTAKTEKPTDVVASKNPHELKREDFVNRRLQSELSAREELTGERKFADTEKIAESQITAKPNTQAARSYYGKEKVVGVRVIGDKTIVELEGANVSGFTTKGKEYIRRVVVLEGVGGGTVAEIQPVIESGEFPGTIVGGYTRGAGGKVGSVFVSPKYRGKGGGLKIVASDMENRGAAIDKNSPHSEGMLAANARKEHRAAVETSLAADKPVAPEVLADYPDLAEKYGKKPAASA